MIDRIWNSQITTNIILVLVLLCSLLIFETPKSVESEPELVKETITHIVYVYIIQEDIDDEEVVVIPEVKTETFEATAYGNELKNPENWKGITRNGFDLKGHTRESAMTIAADPNIIPMNSKVRLSFCDKYKHFDGVYTVRDTGGAIKGNIIDIFLGSHSVREEAIEFGRQSVELEIIE